MDRSRIGVVRKGLAGVAVAVAFCSCVIARVIADDFHIDNKLYQDWDEKKGHPKEPPVETTTLFASGRIYDFMTKPKETIVFDPGQSKIIILDPDRRLKTQILTDEISTQIGKLRQAAIEYKDDVVRESAQAKFAESVDPKTGILTLTNRWMRYEVESMAPDRPQVARQYADAADWLAQLNSMLNPTYIPFPRLALNKVLRARQEVPVKITLHLTPEKHKPKAMHSEHTILMGLSQIDKQRIDEAGEQMHKFTEVPFDEYHKVDEQAQAAAQAGTKR